MKNFILTFMFALVATFAFANTNPVLEATAKQASIDLQVDALETTFVGGCSYAYHAGLQSASAELHWVTIYEDNGVWYKQDWNMSTGQITTSTISAATATSRCARNTGWA